MINSTLALKMITACSLLARYNENIKTSNVYFVIHTFLVLTEHFREEAVPFEGLSLSVTLKSSKEHRNFFSIYV